MTDGADLLRLLAADPDAPAVTWTTRPPKAPGFYWRRVAPGCEPVVVEVYKTGSCRRWRSAEHPSRVLHSCRAEWWPTPLEAPR